MADFSKIFISENLKKVAKEHFGGIGNLGLKAKISNMSDYTKSDPKIMRSEIFFKLINVGVNINYLLTGKGSPMLKDEIRREEFEKLLQEFGEMKKELSALKEAYADVNLKLNDREKQIESYNKIITQKEKQVEELEYENEQLRVQSNRLSNALGKNSSGKGRL